MPHTFLLLIGRPFRYLAGRYTQPNSTGDTTCEAVFTEGSKVGIHKPKVIKHLVRIYKCYISHRDVNSLTSRPILFHICTCSAHGKLVRFFTTAHGEICVLLMLRCGFLSAVNAPLKDYSRKYECTSNKCIMSFEIAVRPMIVVVYTKFSVIITLNAKF